MPRASKLKTKHFATVRDMRIEGKTVAEVARQTGVTRNTISAWERKAKEGGDDWAAARAKRSMTSPVSIREALVKRYNAVASGEEGTDSAASYADTLHKLRLEIIAVDDEIKNPDRITRALNVFIAWARDHLGDEQRDLLDRLLADFDRAMSRGEVAVDY